MKIALLGHGKMGKAIEQMATRQGHTINVIVDDAAEWTDKAALVRACDVAIEFTMPNQAVHNIERCFALQVPIVVGTTGWYDQLDSIVQRCREGNHALFVASNFSIGMNMMFRLNRQLAKLMNAYTDYEVAVDETHHVHKLDAPSGTAVTLATDIVSRLDRKDRWRLTDEVWINTDGTENGDRSRHLSPATPSEVGVHSTRQGEIAGIHTVSYHSAADTLTLTHTAHNRDGLAQGALIAARFLVGRKGYYTMDDLLTTSTD